jgi:hypothetical protein
MKIKELRKAVKEISQEMSVKKEAEETPAAAIEPETAPEEAPAEGNANADFISLLFASRTQAHIFHLQVQGPGAFAAHTALNAYYDGIPALADAIAELIQGRYGIIKGYTTPPSWIEDGNPLAYFQDLVKTVDEAIQTYILTIKNKR